MSSGGVKKNNLNILEKNQPSYLFSNIFANEKKIDHLNFLPELVSFLLEKKNSHEFDIGYKDFLIRNFENDNNSYLKLLEQVRYVLLNCEELTHIQKIDVCSIERHLMKLHLKNVLLKIQCTM